MIKEGIKDWIRRIAGLSSREEAERERIRLRTELASMRKESMESLVQEKRRTAAILRDAGHEETAQGLETQAQELEEKKEYVELRESIDRGFGLNSLYS